MTGANATLNDASDARFINEAAEVHEKYDFKEILGRGVSSTVRRVVERRTGREYAVKIVDVSAERVSEAEAEDVRQATRREVAILRRVSGHPNIIGFYDFVETSTFMFLVFELCKKGELFDYLTHMVTLSERKTRQIMLQLFSAVKYCHDRQVVHRDLKPENILFDDEMNIKLTDFGFACVTTNDQDLRELCGTPGYLAPEILAVSMYENVPGYGRPADLWAAGVIMYTLLCGYAPFWHRKQMLMLRAIMNGEYKFGPEWDDVSLPPKDLIRKLLVVDPRERLSVEQALEHPYLAKQMLERSFNPRKMFRAAILAIRTLRKIERALHAPTALRVSLLRSTPYQVRFIRKVIDANAFRLYGHWIKKGDEQNRAALFENVIKQEVMLAHMRNTAPAATADVHFEY